jgi:hypothetical protein
MNDVENQVRLALNFIRDLCHDKEGWEYSGSEELERDDWGADRFLMFNREDYVVCYVGFREERPLYVLQRIE